MIESRHQFRFNLLAGFPGIQGEKTFGKLGEQDDY